MTDLRHGEGVVVYFHSSSEDVASVVASTSTATATSLFIMDDNESEIFDNTSYMERLSWAVASYSGEWKDDREDGQGMKVYVNGSMFEGEFVAGIEHGRGVFKDSVNGSVYDGDWVQGKRHGQASFTLKGGEKYVGEYRHDLKHGRGLYTALDGVTFDVEFQRDEIVGRGLFRPPKEVDPLYFEEYEGGDRRQDGDTDRDTDRDRDRDSGMLLTLRDGAGYAGGTKAGKRRGQGSYEFSTGAVYEGAFCKGVMQGQGTYTSNIGSVYRGEFRKGKKHGEGVWTRSDGASYVGMFRQDLMEGQEQSVYFFECDSRL